MNSADALNKLREQLENRPDGPVLWVEIGALLEQAWPAIHNSGIHQTSPDKLHRAEELRWKRPCLCFKIERHGGTANGSSRAPIHEWCVNMETRWADCANGRYRQLERRASPVFGGRIAEQAVRAIAAGEMIPGVRYLDPDELQVQIGVFIPATACQMTIRDRRKKFRQTLIPQLEGLGWTLHVPQTLRFRRKAT